MAIYHNPYNEKISSKSDNTKESDLLKEQLAWLENYSKTNSKNLDEIVKNNNMSFGTVKAVYMKEICAALSKEDFYEN